MTHLRIVTPQSDSGQTTSIDKASLDEEPIDSIDARNLRILDAVFHEAALDYAENATTTPEEEADVAAIAAFVAELIRRG